MWNSKRVSCWITLVLLYISIIENVSAIRCSICGQSNLTAPGECTSQFQYDCIPNPSYTDGQQQLNQQQSKILCRTTRTKLTETQFAVVKECVTENEHFNRYPDGKAFGCETVRSNSTYPTTYCVCDQDLCNIHSIDEQLHQPQPQPPQTDGDLKPVATQLASQSRQQSQPSLANNQRQLPIAPSNNHRQGYSNSRISSIVNAPQQPVEPAPVESQVPSLIQDAPSDANVETPGRRSASASVPAVPGSVPAVPAVRGSAPAAVIPSQQHSSGENQAPKSRTTPRVLIALNTERIEFLPETSTEQTGRVNPASGLSCIVCDEENVTSSQDCPVQTPIECQPLFKPGAKLFCFTKAVSPVTGPPRIEKRCTSEEQLFQELGLPVVQPSCFTTQDNTGRTDYCICDTDKCNQLPLSNQANMYPPLSNTDSPGVTDIGQFGPVSSNSSQAQQHPRMCYVCGESERTDPSDCSQQYEFDCSRQYPATATVLCLTRLTKLASGHYNIEKRCITPSEHQSQYPGNEVIQDGCSEAWNGYVQYCICQGDFCNGHNISIQQQQRQRSSNTAKSITDDTNIELETELHQKPPLLVPPSTRLPLSPQSTPSTNSTTGKIIQNPWETRNLQRTQHRSIAPQNSTTAGPEPSRQGTDETDLFSITSPALQPGLSLWLALICIASLFLDRL